MYIGVTGSLLRRVNQHRSGDILGFTQCYAVHRLVHYETFRQIGDAILREKQLKKWKRQWKLRLIERDNPEWRDLYDDLVG